MTEHSVGRQKRDITDAEFIDNLHKLHPGETITGGVKASQIAKYLDLSKRQSRARLKRLYEDGQIRRKAGIRGPTYAPLTGEQRT